MRKLYNQLNTNKSPCPFSMSRSSFLAKGEVLSTSLTWPCLTSELESFIQILCTNPCPTSIRNINYRKGNHSNDIISSSSSSNINAMNTIDSICKLNCIVCITKNENRRLDSESDQIFLVIIKD